MSIELTFKDLAPAEYIKALPFLRYLADHSDPWFFWSVESAQAEMQDAEGFLSFHDEVLVAMILFRKIAADFHYEISFLMTTPDYRGQGIMERTLRAFLAQRADPKMVLWLEVHKENKPALRLYQKIGFEMTGRRPGYYRDGGEAMLMEWRASGGE